ncbi:PLP-dependent aminotransferase family protein [Candidatus Allofournierella excrementavium]|uniref:aminotransferase-like domain-containing protein n=1 Tax=Candidatus Allofournierella excrementavium TaxID=2838591 RepID=UPI00374E8BC5
MEFRYSDKVLGMRPSIIRELLKQMSDPSLISFAGGNPAADSFPVADIRAFSDKLLETDPVGMLQYSVTEGYGPLRQACRDFANRKWPVVKKSDEVIITSGSQQVIEFMAKLLCNEGDVVAVEEPAFLGAYNSMRSFGAVLRGVPLQPDGVDLEALEAAFAAGPKPKFFYCIPNFQNPTGYTTSAAKRKAIYELAVKYGVPVLEDDPYGALRISGEDVPPIKHFDETGAVVYAGSFSKILCPGMRLAYCAGQPEFITKMVTAKQGSDVHTNVWAQRVCERMLRETDMNAHIARLQAIYREKADHMMAQLDEKLSGAVSYVRPEGGMFIWAKLPDEVPAGEFARRCLEKKLAVVPGSAFYTDSAVDQPFVRLNFSTPTKEQIDRGVAVMAEVLAEMTK